MCLDFLLVFLCACVIGPPLAIFLGEVDWKEIGFFLLKVVAGLVALNVLWHPFWYAFFWVMKVILWGTGTIA